MSSKYDSIKTAAELVKEVRLNGLSLVQEDICRAQDIFGNAPIEELVFLANDIGRNNRNGEPDPKGTVSSDRPATQNTFYSILFRIWHWDDATRFWNQHSNPEHEEIVELRAKLKAEMAEHTETKKTLKDEHKALLDERGKVLDLKEKVSNLEAEVHYQNMTIMELKAKLYDLMVKKEGE